MKKNLLVGILVFALSLFFFGATQADAQSGEDNPAEVEAGATIYAGSCAGCHGEDGTGSSRGRPLTDIAAENDRATHFMSVSAGKGGMPAFEDSLSAEQIDAALSYVRLSFTGDDAAASDDAASSDDAELAETGVETPLVAIAGITLMAAGGLFVHHARRESDI